MDEETEKIFHLKQGMVRASFAMYSTLNDAFALINALNDIVKRKNYYQSLYHVDESGNYRHNTFRFHHKTEFSIQACLSELIT